MLDLTWIKLSQAAQDLLQYAAIGGFGGVVYSLVMSHHPSWFDLFKCTVVSAFSGLLAGLGAVHLGLTAYSALFCAGIFGFAGGFGMLLLLTAFAKKLGVNPHEVYESFNALAQTNTAKDYREITDRLLKKQQLTPEQYGKLVCGDASVLNKLLEGGVISGEEFDYLKQWISKENKQSDDTPDSQDMPK